MDNVDFDALKETFINLLKSGNIPSSDLKKTLVDAIISPIVSNAADEIQSIHDTLLKQDDESIKVLVDEMRGFTLLLIPHVINLIHCLLTINERDAVIAYFGIASQINTPGDRVLPSLMVYLNRKYPSDSYPDLHLHLDKINDTVKILIKRMMEKTI